MTELKNIETQDLLSKAVANAIRGIELAYPLFKPKKNMIAFWSTRLLKIDFIPSDIIGGAEIVVDSGVDSFKIDLGLLVRACKTVRSARLKKAHRETKKRVDKKMLYAFNSKGQTGLPEESMKLINELHHSTLPKDEALAIYEKGRLALEKKYGIETGESSPEG